MERPGDDRRAWQGLGAGLALALSLGCAGWDGVLTLTPPTFPEPERGPAMRIESIRDERVFRGSSADSWQPTLRHGSPEQRSVTSRVVGRRGKPDGQQLGNLFVPAGQTVESLVGAAITAAYRRAGYQVLPPGAPDSEYALPIQVQIEQLWTRHKPSLGPPLVEFRVRVRLRALPDFERGISLACAAEISGAAVTASLYARTIDLGLERLAEAVHARLTGRAPVTRCE